MTQRSKTPRARPLPPRDQSWTTTRPALAAVAALGLLVGCATQREPDSYSGLESNFITGCETVARNDDATDGSEFSTSPTAYCRCVFDAISDPEKGYDFEKFKKLNAELRKDPATLPEDLTSTYAQCDRPS